MWVFVKAKSYKIKPAFDAETANVFRYFLFNNFLVFRSYDQSPNVKLLVLFFIIRVDHLAFSGKRFQAKFCKLAFYLMLYGWYIFFKFAIIIVRFLIQNIWFNLIGLTQYFLLVLCKSEDWPKRVVWLYTFKYITMYFFKMCLMLNCILFST